MPGRQQGVAVMPIATPEIYAQMLDRAKEQGFAYPAINVTSSQTLNAALRGFAEAGSDGIIQVSTGGAEYLSGAAVKDMVIGSAALLQFAAAVPADCAAAHIIMEMEIGVVGGEEDGVVGAINEKLYSTPDDALATAEALGLGERGRYILAATFGNVHGVYKPGHVKLRPSVLAGIQEAVGRKYDRDKPFDLVFHGGSGSDLDDIREAISYGVVKMNVDTDTQYAFTRPVADHMFTHYDGVLKVDGEMGSKKFYDPRSWGKAAEDAMSARVVHACEDLLSAGKQLT